MYTVLFTGSYWDGYELSMFQLQKSCFKRIYIMYAGEANLPYSVICTVRLQIMNVFANPGQYSAWQNKILCNTFSSDPSSGRRYITQCL